MKTKTVIFTVLMQSLAMSAFSQNAQTEFAPTGAEWYYTYVWGDCCPANHFNHIISEKDTLVEGSNCHILRQYYDESTTASKEYIIKQEGGKIYYYYLDRFNLLFDFDAEVNDTIEFAFMYKEFDNDPALPYDPLLPHKDTVLPVRFKVESITTNAQNLKTFRTEVLEEDIPQFQLYYAPHTYTYTEKIGWLDEFMPALDNAAHRDEALFRFLRYYSETGFSFISDEWDALSLPYNYYSTAASINIPKDENSTIYPNPFNDKVFVSASDGGSIEIIDVSGKTVHYSELSKGINILSTNQLLKGLFFAKIRYKDNGTRIFKIIRL
ncbi:MAG: T9SS type A sorting domain-containing protein [Prevotella sp.]|jgi:hypothetical protein|nr:T9SS type A sorting domain-containing protein [Prevotella sp.]